MTVENLPTPTVESLRARLNQHRAWFERGDAGGVQLDLDGRASEASKGREAAAALLTVARDTANELFLRNVRLRGLSFADADLAGALLTGAHLNEVDLTGARLDGADLGGATLTAVRLGNASAVGAELGDYWYDCSAEELRAPSSNVVKTEIYRTPLVGAVFDGADMLGVEFHRCDLRRVSFAGANLKRAVFVRCDLRDADLTGANLARARLFDCRLAGVRGVPATVDEVNAEVYDGASHAGMSSSVDALAAVPVSPGEFLDGLRAGRWR